jgi:hypothetical protein
MCNPSRGYKSLSHREPTISMSRVANRATGVSVKHAAVRKNRGTGAAYTTARCEKSGTPSWIFGE